MEPLDLVLGKDLLEPSFWCEAVLLEVVALYSEAVVHNGLIPINAIYVEVELRSFFTVHCGPYLVSGSTLEDPVVIDEVVEHSLHVVHLVRDLECKFSLLCKLFVPCHLCEIAKSCVRKCLHHQDDKLEHFLVWNGSNVRFCNLSEVFMVLRGL